MKLSTVLCCVWVFAAVAEPATAQPELVYRGYTLGSSIAAVLEASGANSTDVKTRHAQPALIQDVEWRPPFAYASSGYADPVRHVVFSFCGDALYQILVSYDSSRTEGLSNADVIAALANAYGNPVPGAARNRPLEAAADTIVLAQWDRAASSLTLLRRVYQSDFQLLLTAKALATRARGAINAAERLERADAPRREWEQRDRDSAAADLALEKIRVANKAAFRP